MPVVSVACILWDEWEEDFLNFFASFSKRTSNISRGETSVSKVNLGSLIAFAPVYTINWNKIDYFANKNTTMFAIHYFPMISDSYWIGEPAYLRGGIRWWSTENSAWVCDKSIIIILVKMMVGASLRRSTAFKGPLDFVETSIIDWTSWLLREWL